MPTAGYAGALVKGTGRTACRQTYALYSVYCTPKKKLDVVHGLQPLSVLPREQRKLAVHSGAVPTTLVLRLAVGIVVAFAVKVSPRWFSPVKGTNSTVEGTGCLHQLRKYRECRDLFGQLQAPDESGVWRLNTNILSAVKTSILLLSRYFTNPSTLRAMGRPCFDLENGERIIT